TTTRMTTEIGSPVEPEAPRLALSPEMPRPKGGTYDPPRRPRDVAGVAAYGRGNSRAGPRHGPLIVRRHPAPARRAGDVALETRPADAERRRPSRARRRRSPTISR